MQKKKKPTNPENYIHKNITPLKLNHPEGHISYHKEEKTTEKFYWVSLSFKREKILLFWWWKRLNKSSKKGKPQLICKCEGVCKRGCRLSWGTAEQLGGGSRAGRVNLGDVPLPIGVLEALGKSCFFSSLCFLLCKIGGRSADIQHLARSEISDIPAGLQIIPEHAFMFPGPPHIALPHLSSAQDGSTPGYFVVLNITTSPTWDSKSKLEPVTKAKSAP